MQDLQNLVQKLGTPKLSGVACVRPAADCGHMLERPNGLLQKDGCNNWLRTGRSQVIEAQIVAAIGCGLIGCSRQGLTASTQQYTDHVAHVGLANHACTD